MSLPVEYEILVPMVIALFFTMIFIFDRKEYLWAGIVAMGVWLVSGAVYLIISTYPVMALVFLAVGILLLTRIMIDLFRPLNEGRILR